MLAACLGTGLPVCPSLDKAASSGDIGLTMSSASVHTGQMTCHGSYQLPLEPCHSAQPLASKLPGYDTASSGGTSDVEESVVPFSLPTRCLSGGSLPPLCFRGALQMGLR